jgi:hypothetical protein
VRESTSTRGPLPRATGVVDSLSAGFGVVNEQPWIIVIPVLLDLFFLFGPRISIAPLVSQLVTRPSFIRTFGADATAPAISFAEDANLLGLLSPGGATLPTIVPVLRVARGSFMFLDSASGALLLALAAILGGLLLGCVYRAILAQQARDGEVSALAVPGETVVAWYRLLLLAVILFGAMIVVIFPLALLAAVASLMTAAASTIITGIVAMLGLTAQLYLFFAPEAIFISRVGPIQAIRRSVAVVHAGVWSALTLAILVTVILIGMGQLWISLAGQASWGLALGIVGNAYIASGLVAASMLFYRERMEILLAQRSS